MNVGFTGTQQGMTKPQLEAFKESIPKEITIFHQGCCIGADEEAVMCLYPTGITIVAYPCYIKNKTSSLALMYSNIINKVKAPLDRNMDIVNASEILIACPKEYVEEIRSGTWATIRRARKKNIPIIYIYPDGTSQKVLNHE